MLAYLRSAIANRLAKVPAIWDGGATICYSPERSDDVWAQRGAFPKLLSAKRKGTQIRIEVSEVSPRPTELLEVQINFNNGIFRKHSHSYPDGIAEREVIVKRQFRSRKGFTDFLMISGDGFLQGVVISESY